MDEGVVRGSGMSNYGCQTREQAFRGMTIAVLFVLGVATVAVAMWIGGAK